MKTLFFLFMIIFSLQSFEAEASHASRTRRKENREAVLKCESFLVKITHSANCSEYQTVNDLFSYYKNGGHSCSTITRVNSEYEIKDKAEDVYNQSYCLPILESKFSKEAHEYKIQMEEKDKKKTKYTTFLFLTVLVVFVGLMTLMAKRDSQ